jgi:teichuronic acid biosynthesis glycosyltransferase TuaG
LEPYISIITPSYNSAAFIAETIESVIAQRFKNWEMIVVDDKSTDNTCEVVERFIANGANINLVKLAANGGVAEARNVGLSLAKGKYIAFLDSDDIWLPEKLAVQVQYMDERSLPMTFCAYQRVDIEGNLISGQINAPREIDYQTLLWHNLIIFSTSLTLRSAIGDLKFVKLGHEDWIFWLDLFKKCGKGYGINKSMALYRVRKGSISANKFIAIHSTWTMLRQHEKIGFVKSMYLFSKYAFATVWKRLK